MYGAEWGVDYNLVEIKVYVLHFIKIWIIWQKLSVEVGVTFI